MTILFVGNTPAQFIADSSVLTLGTSTEHRDPDFVPNDIEYTAKEGGSIYFGLDLPVSSDDFWLHFRFYHPRVDNPLSLGSFEVLKFYDASDNELMVWRGFHDSGNLENVVDVKGDTVESSESWIPGRSISLTYDFHFERVGTTSLTATVYVNGVKKASATAVNSGGKGSVSRVSFDNYNMTQLNVGSTDVGHYSEIIATDAEVTRNWRLAQLNPASGGAHTDFSGSYTALADGDLVSGVSGQNNGDRMSNGLSAYNGPVTTTGIRSVVGAAVAQRGVTGPNTLKQSLRIGATDYDGSAVAVGESLGQLVEDWDVNPATSSPWSTADFASMELGLLAQVVP